jgi:hypothetical protein
VCVYVLACNFLFISSSFHIKLNSMQRRWHDLSTHTMSEFKCHQRGYLSPSVFFFFFFFFFHLFNNRFCNDDVWVCAFDSVCVRALCRLLYLFSLRSFSLFRFTILVVFLADTSYVSDDAQVRFESVTSSETFFSFCINSI